MTTDCIYGIQSYHCPECRYFTTNPEVISTIARIYHNEITVKACPECSNKKNLRLSFIGVCGEDAE